jgi:hypothetical protein
MRTRLFLADDSETVRKLLRDAFTEGGSEVCGDAANGLELVEKVEPSIQKCIPSESRAPTQLSHGQNARLPERPSQQTNPGRKITPALTRHRERPKLMCRR